MKHFAEKFWQNGQMLIFSLSLIVGAQGLRMKLKGHNIGLRIEDEVERSQH